MAKVTYKTILEKAYECKNNTEKNYKIGIPAAWSYYFAKSILAPRKDITKLSFEKAPKPSGTSISRQIYQKDYISLCKSHIKYVEKHKRMPNYNIYKTDFHIEPSLFAYALARILIYQYKHNTLPNYVNVNSKVFNKPTETTNEVYNYFIKVFGSFGDTIDGALAKISGNGYGYYYDDTYSNKQSIDRMKKGLGVNCTDSCHVFYNIMLALIQKGKYRKVECLHVRCSGGDGHVRLRITLKDGTKIYRDPACTLSSGGTCNWCTTGYSLLAVDPGWFKENLNR